MTTNTKSKITTLELLHQIVQQRIMVIDGAMGTMIRLKAKDGHELDAYVAEMRAEGYAATALETPEAVCRAADVIVTATPARPCAGASNAREGAVK